MEEDTSSCGGTKRRQTESALRTTLGLLFLTLIAFAGNSLLCRIALYSGAADPIAFTAIRLLSGALMLVFLQALRKQFSRPHFDPVAVICLYCYAVLFSIAYVALDTGIGALFLFFGVQVTMLGAAVWHGDRPALASWYGFALAASGLLWLLFPRTGADAPPLLASAEMLAAGVAWGGYTVRGARCADPLSATRGNFIGVLPLVTIGLLLNIDSLHADQQGAMCAVLAGAVMSALGYALWYSLLPRLPTVTAATAQLAVPVLAAFGGVAFLGEAVTFRLLASAVLILSGIALVLLVRPRPGVTREAGQEG